MLLLFVPALAADEPAPPAADRDALHAAFAESMKNVKLVGTFTVDGAEGKMQRDEYTIASATKRIYAKLGVRSRAEFTSRMKGA